ncbi:MAG: hypothetical protein B6240_03335 [Desulfobacteraceae bacterium 4572_87]|nr:MAG: hypothetical protein B6240_03335 [Desulfobacteraceae bacterium 4572_87]
MGSAADIRTVCQGVKMDDIRSHGHVNGYGDIQFKGACQKTVTVKGKLFSDQHVPHRFPQAQPLFGAF